jgi:hypothetical protein
MQMCGLLLNLPIVVMNTNMNENIINTGPSPPLDIPIIDITSLISVGDLVLVDSCVRGYITSISCSTNYVHEDPATNAPPTNDNSIFKFKIKYILDNNSVVISDYRRIRVISMNDNTGMHTHNENNKRHKTIVTPTVAPTDNPTRNNNFTELQTVFKASYKHTNKMMPNPLHLYLKSNVNKYKGWVRNIINKKNTQSSPTSTQTSNNKQHLSTHESNTLLCMSFLMLSYSPTAGINKGWMKYIRHAFNISENCHIKIFQRFINNGFILERKVRKDKGTSVFTCDKKRKQTFTAYNTYKKVTTHSFMKIMIDFLRQY